MLLEVDSDVSIHIYIIHHLLEILSRNLERNSINQVFFFYLNFALLFNPLSIMIRLENGYCAQISLNFPASISNAWTLSYSL